MPIWIGSWGSDAGLRRVARLADGWLGSALDSTPDRFKHAKKRLDAFLQQEGKDPSVFPNAVSTMALYIGESKSDLERVPREPEHCYDPNEAPHERTMVGSPSECGEKLHRWKDSGAQALFLSPFEDGLTQMRLFMEQVASDAYMPVFAEQAPNSRAASVMSLESVQDEDTSARYTIRRQPEIVLHDTPLLLAMNPCPCRM